MRNIGTRLYRDGAILGWDKIGTRLCGDGVMEKLDLYIGPWEKRRSNVAGFQARSKDLEILEEGGGAGPSLLPRRDHE